MERSFSIVNDDIIDDFHNEEFHNPTKTKSKQDKKGKRYNVDADEKSNASDSDEDISIDHYSNENVLNRPKPLISNRPLSAGPSGIKNKSKSFNNSNISSGSDEFAESDNDEARIKSNKIPGEYDPKAYDMLEINNEIKEMFQYIIKYTPQHHDLDNQFKPFIPDFLPAVGDIDAFLKVIPPELMLSGEVFDFNKQLGLTVLDEPVANQSDPALLHLQLRAGSVNATHRDSDVIVKKVDNVEKNAKVVDKWVKDISDLHKSKSSPTVRYLEPMPDLDDLMQEWPENVENKLKENGFPSLQPDMTLNEYVVVVCELFQIPATKNKIQSLHLLFCLYAAIKSSQLFQVTNTSNEKVSSAGKKETVVEADQLVLE